MKLFNKIAYHSTKQKGLKNFDDVTGVNKAKTGEGAMVHGWGLYLQEDKWLNIENYKRSFGITYKDPDLNDYGYYLQSLIVDGKNYNRFGNCDKNKWGIVEVFDNGDYEEISDGDFADELNDVMDNCWTFDISTKEELEDYCSNFCRKHDCDVIAKKVNPEDNVDKYNASQYTVEIPDEWVFLREDGLISDTINDTNRSVFEGVVKSLWKLVDRSKTTYDQWRDLIFGIDGKTLYHFILKDLLGSEQRASWYLSEHGISGISYKGGVDGECYVIFDCEGLKIIKEE